MLVRVQEAGFEMPFIQSFRSDLAKAGRASIDAFLEKRSDYLSIGKACIAAALIPFEREYEFALFRHEREQCEGWSQHLEERRSRRWYHYLFDQMLTGGDVRDNRLTIVTFNFDRSFERALYHTVCVHYPGDEEAIREICRSVPVIHVHGRLGAPDWLEPSEPLARPYGHRQLLADDISACAEQIRLVTDAHDDPVLSQVHDALESATAIYFLGFSYHHLNLSKLGIDKLEKRFKDVAGTAFKMPSGPQRAVMEAFGQLIKLSDCDVLTFLQEGPLIHE
jgi:hypothetical protein